MSVATLVKPRVRERLNNKLVKVSIPREETIVVTRNTTRAD